MASLTIRNLENNLKARLRLRAASHGCSMEAEARNILRQVLAPVQPESNFAASVHARFASLEIESLPVPTRQEVRTPPDFGDEG